jgi:subtilisin
MIRRLWWVPFLLVALLVACSTGDDADAYLDGAASATASAGERYIVVLSRAPGTASAVANRAEAADVARAHGLNANRSYGAALVGFAAHVPAGRLAALQRDPRVAYVERDDPVELFAQTIPTGVQRIFAPQNANIGIDGTDDVRVDVDVAVIDTGVDFQHPDLNVAGGVDCTVSSGGGPPWSRNYYCSASEGTGGDDDHYHGTHVAGTIGALDDGAGVVGVAPGARIWAVKVLDAQGSGYESGIVAGIDWVVERGGIEVANLSLGGSGFSQAEYDAIQGAVNAGVAFAVAAGNSAADAGNYSPAAFDNVLTVSALADFDGSPGGSGAPTCRTDVDDTLADFSNVGSAVDIAAPGVCILSTYPIEQGSYGTISGTSMASPHVAGALALLASTDPPANATEVHALYAAVKNAGNFDWIDDSGDGVKEPLLDVSDTTLFAPATVVGGGDGGDDGGDGGGGGGGGGDEPAAVDLAVSAYKVRGVRYADLTWSGAVGTNVDVYRDGTWYETTANDGAFTDATGLKGGGTFTYQVCEEGGTTCSSEVDATW